jgi:hypothetical protein
VPRSLALTTLLVLSLLAAVSAVQQPQVARVAESAAATVAGELVIEPATLINLGFEWFIQSDANRNAAVAVSFRKAGESANNLMLGENALPAIFAVTTFTNYTSSDYNGFRPNAGAMTSFEWNSPALTVAADFTGPGHAAALETRRYASLAEYAKATGQDRNSVLVDYDVFVKVPKLDAQDAAAVQKLYDARDVDFRLRAGFAAVDRGVVLPTVTDGFSGRAPDLGALESGAAAATYGPRPTPVR